MHIKTIVFCSAMLLPSISFAEKGSFDFIIDRAINSYPPSCIESVQYVDKNEIDSEELQITLTEKCGKMISEITKKNIGKQAVITYKNNRLTTVNIISRLGSSFRISAKNMPKIVLMQILDDYGVRNDIK